ncbi:MAG: uroporphyrinogen-III synthase [Magnetococcales bacterium]|nr:uroporphyrinogen-III synthase [Magnetococcales bacterium]
METKSLDGRRILITRPLAEGEETAARIRAAGGVPLLAPVLELAPPHQPEALATALNQLDRYDGLIVTSVNGARALLAALKPGPSRPPIYAVGEKTAAVLRQAGWQAKLPTQPEDALRLAETILGEHPDAGHFLFLRAEEGREELPARLRATGCQVTLLTAYRMIPTNALPEPVLESLAKQTIDAVLFFSSRTAEVFLQLLPPDLPFPGAAVVAALSPKIAASLASHGIPCPVVAESPNTEELLQALRNHFT